MVFYVLLDLLAHYDNSVKILLHVVDWRHLFSTLSKKVKLSLDMTKPTMWLCAQRRLRSAWASAQFDQSSLSACRKHGSLALPIKRTAKTLIRLGGCPGWSESSLGAHSFCWFCHVAAQMHIPALEYKMLYSSLDTYVFHRYFESTIGIAHSECSRFF